MIQQRVGIVGHLFICKCGRPKFRFALSPAIHRNYSVVFRELPNLMLETFYGFTVSMNQQQRHALSIHFVVEASPIENKGMTGNGIVAVGDIGRSRCYATSNQSNQPGDGADMSHGHSLHDPRTSPSLHAISLARAMTGYERAFPA